MTESDKPFDNRPLTERLDINFALTSAGLGVWELDPITNLVLWDDRCRALFGLATANQLPFEQAIQYIHPQDVTRVTQAVQWALNPASGGTYDVTYRTLGADDGKLRWVRFWGQSYFTPAGEVYRFSGVAQEVTQSVKDQQKLEENQAQLHSIVQQTPAPTLVLRGDEYIIDQINGPMLAFMGRGEEVIGQPFLAVMPELAHQFAWQQVQRVYQEGIVFDRSEVLVPHVRQGILQDRYYDVAYRPLREGGQITGMIQVAIEVTDRVLARQQADEIQRQLLALFEQSPVGLATYSADDAFVIDWANPFFGELVARPPQAIVGKPLLEALPELQGQGFDELLKNVMATRKPFAAPEVAVGIVRDGQLTTIYVDLTYQPQLGPQGEIQRILVVATDVTQQVISRQKITESETRFRTLAEQAPIFVFESDVDATVVYWNLRWLEFVGQTQQEALGRDGWPKVMHPDDYDRLLTTYIRATAAKQSYEIQVRVRRKDGVYRTVLFTGKPRYTSEGTFNGYIGNGIDISTQVENQLVLAESEAKLRAILDNARAAIGVYIGPDMVIENPNQVFIDIVGKGTGITGKPLREAMPELVSEGQPLLAILDEVFMTGIGYSTTGTLIKIFRNGELTNNYYNFSYTPVLDQDGKTYEIVVVAIDVTDQINIRQTLEEKEATLRGAIELAQMGTWELNMQSGVTTYSEKLKQLFEFTQDYIELDRLYNPILEADRARLVDAVSRAANPESNGLLDEEYTVITQRTGRHRIVWAQAKMFFDPQGQPIKLVGSMRDVTEERQTQLALEQLVQERTEQLAAANEELAANNDVLEANNEEYAAINEEVEEANRLLARSNDNLQKFAYVASHDLQEPLRKIQQFGDLLKAHQVSLSGDALSYIGRMQSAASRMAALIRDLLDFSRISTQRDSDRSVSLTSVVEQVLTTLELVIAETNAEIRVEPLPTVQGDEIQLAQLFQNLISNALKFRRPSMVPQIHITTQTQPVSELPATVKLVRSAERYYRIDVADNGVGFDEKYLDRIFEVFQRLHGKNEFAGTGIGLAICERVVANHGGAITASSQPGQGATFVIYLPV